MVFEIERMLVGNRRVNVKGYIYLYTQPEPHFAFQFAIRGVVWLVISDQDPAPYLGQAGLGHPGPLLAFGWHMVY